MIACSLSDAPLKIETYSQQAAESLKFAASLFSAVGFPAGGPFHSQEEP